MIKNIGNFKLFMVLPTQLICLFGKQNLFFFLNCPFQSRTLFSPTGPRFCQVSKRVDSLYSAFYFILLFSSFFTHFKNIKMFSLCTQEFVSQKYETISIFQIPNDVKYSTNSVLGIALSCRFSNLPRATILLKVLISFISVCYRFRRICRIYLIGVIV